MSNLFYLDKSPLEAVYYKSFEKLTKFKFHKKEEFINVLIICNGNKDKFKKCFDSVKKQCYFKFNIYIAFNSDYSSSYIVEIAESASIFYIKYNTNTDNPKHLSSKIKNTFFTVSIDENDMFIHRNCLKYINHYINDYDIIYWNNYDATKSLLTICYCYNGQYKDSIEDISNNSIETLLEDKKMKILKQNVILIKNI